MLRDVQTQRTRPEKPSSLAARLAHLRGYWVAVLFFFAAAVSVAAYLFSSSGLYGIGFPLDDAWIHQTYARNLALYGEWAFVHGVPSAGSTAPLWSMLLALGYVFRIPHFFWTFLLGCLCLFALGIVGEAVLHRIQSGVKNVIPWAGLFLIGEWHFAWAAVSGMETLLTAVIFLLILWTISRANQRAWVGVGLLLGLSVWLRPDGITLLGPAVFVMFFTTPGWRSRVANLGWLVAGFGLIFIPYLLFNLLVQGSIWPNTFYAKQAEYAVLREQLPLASRYLSQLSLPLIGSGLFLLPGFIFAIWQALRRKDWFVLGAVIWFFGYALVYALRLPVVYQYGRYFMPAMPVYFVCGIAGTLVLVGRMRARRWSWVLARVWILSLIGIWIGFFVIGANQYAQDVAIIESEMVVAAHWISDNTPPGAVIAAHDIGALGYFAQRRLVDLAGLVSPEVIPFISDEEKISDWLNDLDVEYLVVLDGWYQHLPAGKEEVYRSEGSFSIPNGGSNIVVYRWLP